MEVTRKEKIKKIVELIKTYKQGDTIDLITLNKIINEDLKDEYGKQRFTNIMFKVKNELIENGILIRRIYNKGYYILKNNQVSSYTYRNYIVKPTKTIEKANRILNKFSKKDLTMEELITYNETQILSNNINKLLENQLNNRNIFK